MMNKLLLSILLAVLLLPLVTSFEFDNVKSYDSIKNEIIFTNTFAGIEQLPLGEIAKAKLDTPQVNYVMPGKDRLVAQMTIDSYGAYTDFIKGMELIDLNTGKIINREISYKYATYEDNYVDVPDTYKEFCEKDRCFNRVETYKKENHPITKWIPLEKLDLKQEKITIGIFTDVGMNDKVEWYPQMFGMKVTEWATWTASFNTGLLGYWTFNETTGTNARESTTGISNGTLTGTQNWTTGIIGNSFGYMGNNFFKMGTNDAVLETTQQAIAVSFWTYMYGNSAEQTFIQKMTNNGGGTDNGFFFNSYPGEVGRCLLGIRLDTGFQTIDTGTGNCVKPQNTWVHVVFMWDAITDRTLVYINGTLKVNSSNAGTVMHPEITQELAIGARIVGTLDYLNAKMDEVSIYNRTLSGLEVTDLYNSGAGMTYTNQFGPTATLNSPIDNYVSNSATIVFNVTGNSLDGLTNISLYDNSTGTWKLNQTKTITGTVNTTTFTNTITPDKKIKWGVEVCDALTCAFSSNYTLTIDTISPVITIINPNSSYIVQNPSENISLNYSISHVGTLSACWYNTSSNGTINYISCTQNTSLIYPITNPSSLTIYVYSNDSVNNLGFTNVTIGTDNTAPNISVLYPTGLISYGYIGQNISLNYSITDSNLQSCWYGYPATTCYQETANQSNSCGGLASGSYRFADRPYSNEEYFYDGLWNSNSASADTSPGESNLIYINYTIPAKTINATWQVSFYYDVDTIRNYSMPSSCLSGNTLQLLINITDMGTDFDGSFSCKNATAWKIFEYNDTSLIIGNFYEEAIIWDYGKTMLNCSKNSSIILTSDKSLTIYANDSFGNVNSLVKSWDYSLLVYNTTYNPTTIAGNTETFVLNLSSSPDYSSITTYLIYNGTRYSMSLSGGLYSTSLIVPQFNGNVSFYFNILLSNSSTLLIINTSSNNQFVVPFNVDNCSSYNKKLLSFTMIDEETMANISGTINIALKLYSSDRTILINTYNGTLNYLGVASNPVSICAANVTGNYSMDYTAQFYSNQSLYFIKYKALQNFVLSNLTLGQNITLYNLLYASGNIFQIQVAGASSTSGLLVDIQKEYLAQNAFNSVESYITDAGGFAIGHLTQASAVYNFIVSRNGIILGTFNNYQVKCANTAIGDCVIVLNLQQATTNIDDYKSYGNIQGSYQLNVPNRTLYFTYVTTDGNAHTVDQEVRLMGSYSNITICNSSSYGTSGTIICVIPPSFGNSTFEVRMYVHSLKMFLNDFLFSLGEEINYNGIDMFMELLLYSTLVMLFMSNPAFIIIGAMLGILISAFLIFLGGATIFTILSIIGWFVAAGIIAIARMGRRTSG